MKEEEEFAEQLDHNPQVAHSHQEVGHSHPEADRSIEVGSLQGATAVVGTA